MAGVHDSSTQPFFLILDPSDAGKTTLMYRLYSDIFFTAVQVDNRNVEEVHVDNVRLRTLNIVKNNLQKETWIPLTQGSSGIILVVDITSSDSLTVTYALYQNIRAIENLKTLPLLVCVNKIDLKEKSNFKFFKHLDLPGTSTWQHDSNSESCKTTEGIREGLEWLMEKTKTFFYILTFRKQVI